MRELNEFTIHLRVTTGVGCDDGERIRQFIVSNEFGRKLHDLLSSMSKTPVRIDYKISCDSLLGFSERKTV